MSYHIKDENTEKDPIEIQFTMRVTEMLQWYIYCLEESGERLRDSYGVEDLDRLLLDFFVCEIQCLEKDHEAIRDLLKGCGVDLCK